MEKKLVEGKSEGRPITMSNVVLAITVAFLAVVIIGGGFMAYSLSQRVKLLESEMNSMDSEEVRDKRQTSRGSCYVCPTGPPGPRGYRGYDGRNGKKGSPGVRGPRGLKGRDGECNCQSDNVYTTRSDNYQGSKPAQRTTAYVSTPSADVYGSTTDDYGVADITSYTDNQRANRPTQSYTTDSYVTAGNANNVGYASQTGGYVSPTVGYVSPTVGYVSLTNGYTSPTGGYVTSTVAYEPTTRRRRGGSYQQGRRSRGRGAYK